MATEFRSTEDVVKGIERSTYEIQTESRLVYSGLKREQNIAEILEESAEVGHGDLLVPADIDPAQQRDVPAHDGDYGSRRR